MLPISTSQKMKAAGYDPDTQTLRVQLRTGEMWEYTDVPSLQWQSMMAGTDDDVWFNSIDYAQRTTKKLIPQVDEFPLPIATAERLREIGLRAEFGKPDAPTRQRYEELMKRRAQMPVTDRVAWLEEQHVSVVARLSAVNFLSDPQDVAGLIIEEMATARIISTTANVYDEIDHEVESLRASFKASEERRAGTAIAQQQFAIQSLRRLGELRELLKNQPTLDSATLSTLEARGMTVTQMRAAREENWKLEAAQLRAASGLPEGEQPEERTNDEWMAKLQAKDK
jgi:hypothetical protein